MINLSLGGDVPDTRVKDAIAAAAAANVLVVCSAGNSGRDIDAQPSYPVSFAAPNLIGVAATVPDAGRRLGDFSNFGRATVSLAAPGESVLSTTNDGGYGLKSGTSMAAPHVAGVAALMISVAPNLSVAELRAQLLEHAARAGVPVGSGYLDALGSVRGVTGATDTTLGQRPQLRVLAARTAGRGKRAQTVVQFAVSGEAAAMRRYRVRLAGRPAVTLAPGRSILAVRLRGRPGRRVVVQALDARGKPLATTRRGSSGSRPASSTSRAGAASGWTRRDARARRRRARGAARAGRAGRRGHGPRERLDHHAPARRRPRMVLPPGGAPPAALHDRRRRERGRDGRRGPRHRRPRHGRAVRRCPPTRPGSSSRRSRRAACAS